MPDIQFIPSKYGVRRDNAYVGKIADGTITFASADNLTTEKTATIQLEGTSTIHPDNLYLLAVERPGNATMGVLTIKTYNSILFGSNQRDILHTTHTMSSLTAVSDSDFLIQGLFMGDGTIKIVMSFDVDDSEIIEPYYYLGRI